MRRTNIYLEERQCAALDRIARQRGRTRSEVIRSMLDECLYRSDLDRVRLLAAIEASAGSEPDIELPQRGRDARAEHLDRMWRR